MKISSFLLTVSFFFLASCSSLSRIGPEIESPWDCGIATSETKSASCIINEAYPNSQYANIFGSYSGSVIPINYNEAVPHGWGKVTLLSPDVKKGTSISVKFQYGQPIDTKKIVYLNGSSFIGKVYSNMVPKYGTQETAAYTYKGHFMRNGNHSKGKIIYKDGLGIKPGSSFSGDFQTVDGVFYPDFGTFSQKGEDCEVGFEGKFFVDKDSKVFSLWKENFSIKHPFAKIKISERFSIMLVLPDPSIPSKAM